MKPLKPGQKVMIQFLNPPLGNVVVTVNAYAGKHPYTGEDLYDLSLCEMIRLPREKIWDYDTMADNCRGSECTQT